MDIGVGVDVDMSVGVGVGVNIDVSLGVGVDTDVDVICLRVARLIECRSNVPWNMRSNIGVNINRTFD